MKTYGISNNITNQYQFSPAFKSCNRTYFNDAQGLTSGKNIQTATCLLRETVDYIDIPELTRNFIELGKKLKIVCLGCSDGSQPYSISIALREKLPNSMHNKIPVIEAYDKDEEIIKAAQCGRINLYEDDFIRLKDKLNTKKNYFINPFSKLIIKGNLFHNFSDYKSYKVIPEIRQSVKFRVGDLLDITRNYCDEDITIMTCSNVTQYLSHVQVNELAENLQNNLNPKSIFITGHYDKYSGIYDALEHFDFIKISENVYQKMNEPKLFYY